MWKNQCQNCYHSDKDHTKQTSTLVNQVEKTSHQHTKVLFKKKKAKNKADVKAQAPKTKLTTSQMKEYKDAFNLVDTDVDGLVSPKEVTAMLKKLGFQSSIASTQDVFIHFDFDGDGFIDFDGFIAMMQQKPFPKKSSKKINWETLTEDTWAAVLICPQYIIMFASSCRHHTLFWVCCSVYVWGNQFTSFTY